MIRPVASLDVVQICDIYNFHVANTIISFEEEPVSVFEMGKRIDSITSTLPFYVFVENNRILGFTFATKWKTRTAFKNLVESTIYVRPDEYRKGIGRQLYSALLNDVKSRHIHTVIAGISLPNKSSIVLHEKMGFTKVAHFHQIGYKFDKWIDVGYWQLLFD